MPPGGQPIAFQEVEENEAATPSTSDVSLKIAHLMMFFVNCYPC